MGDALKDEVKARYADLALGEMSPCYCGNYSPADLEGLPSEAIFSLGCGNPVALANLTPGQVVLDIGSGAGLDVLLAARKVGPKGKVIGLDITEEMVKRAARAARLAGYNNVESCIGDAEDIPLPDASVDIVISNCVFNLTLDKARVFREAYRVLKPGGRMIISDVVTDKPLPETVRSDPDQWVRCIAGAMPDDKYIDLILKAGFKGITCAHEGDYQRIGDVRVYSVSISARKPV